MKKALILSSVSSMIDQFNRDNINLLIDKGYEVHVISNFKVAGTIDISKSEDLKNNLESMGVLVHDIGISRFPFSISNISALKKIKKIVKKEKFKIVHLHSPVGGVLGRIACKKEKNTKVIYTAHGFHFYKGSPKMNWLIYYSIEKYMSKYTDVLITINQEDYKLAKNKFSKIGTVEYIPGTGVSPYNTNKNVLIRKNIGLNENDFVLIFGAEINKNKNQIMLLKMMKELQEDYPQIKLLLVGKKNSEIVEKFIIEENLDNVLTLGYRSDLRDLIQLCDVAVSSSLREGLGVFIIEAMMQGLPIVATNNRGSRELITDNGYLVDFSVSQFKDAILKIYLNKGLQEEFSYKSKKNAEKFSIKNVMEIMDDIYSDI